MNEQGFKILCLSGGGALGMYSARLLAHLEAAAGRPLRDCFDLICGTSIGGMFALGLAAGVPAARLEAVLFERGPEVFPDSQGAVRGALRNLRMVVRARHDAAPLRGTLEALLGPAARLGDFGGRVAVTAVDLDAGEPRLLSGLSAPKMTLVEAGLATSAAPVLLPLTTIAGRRWADGGLFANAPDLVALGEAEAGRGVPRGAIAMLSLGTTLDHFALPSEMPLDSGLLAWGADRRALWLALAAQGRMASAQAQAALGERYLRIDSPTPDPSRRVLTLDNASPAALRQHVATADRAWVAVCGDPRLAALLGPRGATGSAT